MLVPRFSILRNIPRWFRSVPSFSISQVLPVKMRGGQYYKTRSPITSKQKTKRRHERLSRVRNDSICSYMQLFEVNLFQKLADRQAAFKTIKFRNKIDKRKNGRKFSALR